MWVPVNSVSSEPAIDVFAEAANTVMKPTSATPIISDDAVRAVRFGFRIALRVASSPLSPRIRSGTPNTLATGRASTGPRTATPTNVASAPTPTSAISPPSPANSAATPAAVITEPATARRAEPAERSTLTSRSAAIGAILAARRAGSHADSTVTTTPTANERIIAFGSITVGPSGMSNPNADISCRSPAATATPAARPAADASTPMTAASIEHRALHLPARRTDRPQHRHLTSALGDGDRERVVDDERTDEHGDEGEDHDDRRHAGQELGHRRLVLGDQARRR